MALVGDAGYCPGPAVGGSTSLAVIGAYMLAAGADLGAAKTLIPASRVGVWALMRGMQVFTALPWLVRPLAKLDTKGLRMHDSMRVRDYERQGAETSAP